MPAVYTRTLLTASAILFTVSIAKPVAAMVGGALPAEGEIARAVATIVGSRGNFCTGTFIAQDVLLTAAHCVPSGADYKIVRYDAQRQPTLLDVKRLSIHPQFAPSAITANRATADLALLQLAQPLASNVAPLGVPAEPLAAGNVFQVAGAGVTVAGDGKSGGTIRTALLTATSKPGRLQIRLVDPTTNNARNGLGACTGDSGAPVLEKQEGRSVVIGVVSWSTAANNAAGCGGLTGVTPLTLYRDWIARTLESWRGR